MVHPILVATSVFAAASKTVPLATFDGAKETTRPFVPVNDPVMGGQSKSTFTVSGNVGVFEGEVKVVTFLGSPGFCNLEAPGFRSPAITFPDISGTDGINIEMAQTLDDGLTNWDVSLQTATSKNASRTGDAGWQAKFDYKAGQSSYFLPYSAFKCSSRGRPLSNCGDLGDQLAELEQLGIGTDGVAGPFRLELTSISAASSDLEAKAETKLATWDGAKATSALKWTKVVDPVMGGASVANYSVTADGTALFQGRCNIVPSLKAPGFANIRGTTSRSLADISQADNLALKLRSSTPGYTGFKIEFGAPGIPSSGFGTGSYKSEFNLTNTMDWQVVEVPLGYFSRDTSAYTGRCDSKDPGVFAKQHYCCPDSGYTPSKPEVCVDRQYLSEINSIAVLAEGVEGDFNLEIEWIGATTNSVVV